MNLDGSSCVDAVAAAWQERRASLLPRGSKDFVDRQHQDVNCPDGCLVVVDPNIRLRGSCSRVLFV